jgi:hypothetical protein
MLSEPEQRVLHEIERTIVASDPGLASLLTASHGARRRRGARVAHDVVCVVAALSGVLCLGLGQIASGLAALVFAAVVLEVRRARFPSGSVRPIRARRRRL